jgi:hypothetical protein
MRSDFELSCKIAREAIVVPTIPLGAIRDAAQDQPRKAGLRRRALIAGIVASASVVAAAAAAEVFGHVQVSLSPSGTMTLYADGLGGHHGPIRNPKDEDFQKAARAMNFPVILPKGLPDGATAEWLMVYGPGAMEIIYNLPGAWRRSNHLLMVTLANPKSVAPENAAPPHTKYTLQHGQKKGLGAVKWMVGQEEVIVLKSTITPAELAHFKATMMAQAR